MRAVSSPAPRPAAGYLLVAHDAHFTALFPRKPLRMEKTAGTTTVIVYLADLPGYAVGIICAPVPASRRVRLDRAVNVAASALPGGEVVSRHRLTYHRQPAEDAAISVLGEPGQIRVAVFGSSAYLFEGFGATAASFAHDYQILLDTFTPHPVRPAQRPKRQPQATAGERKDHDRQCDPDPANAPATGRPGHPAAAAPAAAPRQLSRLAGHRIGQYAHLQQC